MQGSWAWGLGSGLTVALNPDPVSRLLVVHGLGGCLRAEEDLLQRDEPTADVGTEVKQGALHLKKGETEV